jgi:transposase
MDNSDEVLRQRALHMAQVEKLTGRQILGALGVGYRRIKRLLAGDYPKNPVPKVSSLEPYRRILEVWYKDYPRLKASQIYEKLRPYGYTGSYSSIRRFTRDFRQKKVKAYFNLEFLPGEEAQVDWFFFRHPKIGLVAGFLYLLAHSRYAWGRFYPRTSFEFFLKGHLDVFEHLKGLARRHRYDNLKSVVI